MTARIHYTPPAIDFSTFPDSDGKPMAENEDNAVQMTNLIFTLDNLLRPLGHKVGGNILMYYNPRNGRDQVSPDVYVALHVPTHRRRMWKTWEEGKFPEVVFEITSPSTQDEDLGNKRHLYARLGVQEYYIYDSAGKLSPAFRAYRRVDDRLEPADLLPSGGVYSPLIGYELRPVGQWLRVIDPETGRPFPTPEEERLGRFAAEERAEHAEERAEHAEERARREEQARRAAEERAAQAEERAAQEAQARRVADALIAELEARLRAAGQDEPEH